jgi:copper chaperone CopZ
MTCNHCVMNVHKALTNVEGVNSVEVELKNGKAVVTGVDFKAESLKKAVEDLGYKVMVVG